MTAPKPTNFVSIAIPPATEHLEPNFPDVFDTNLGQKTLKTADNLNAMIDFYQWKVAYNLMTAEPEVLTSNWERLGKHDDGQRSLLIDACQRHDLPEKAIDDHLIALCRRNEYHPVRKWLESGGPWDGVKRVTDAIKTLNAADPYFAERVITPWLVGCVAALYEDNFRAKLVPVLQGAQSFKKSAWIERIGSVLPGAILDCSVNPDKPDDIRRAVSAWIVELAELESTTKHETGSLKAFITRDVDRFRIPYSRNFTEKKRQTTFVASVNGTDFLKDLTGNARFAVVEMAQAADVDKLNTLLGWSWADGRLTHINSELLRQFWLEVKGAYKAGESWHLDEATSIRAAGVNDGFTNKGAIYDKIIDNHLAREYTSARWFTVSELCESYGDKPGQCGHYGRALKLLADEGRIESRALRSRRNEYRLPVNEVDSNGAASH